MLKKVDKKKARRGIIITIAVIFCYFSVLQPVKVYQKEVVCCKANEWLMDSLLDTDKKDLNLRAYGGELPSTNADDYVQLYIMLHMSNRSFLSGYEAIAEVKQIAKGNERVIQVSDGEIFEMESLFGAYEQKDSWISLDVYRGGLKDEELKQALAEIVNGITMRVSYKMNLLPGRSSTGKLKVHSGHIVETTWEKYFAKEE